MFVETHIIQNFAPSNLNRDDTNAPKDCLFGGRRRARISSQCFKRAIRTSQAFSDGVGDGTGKRTRRLIEQVCDRIEQSNVDRETIASVAAFALEGAGFKLEKASSDEASTARRTQVALFLSPGEIDQYAAIISENFDALAAEAGKKKGKLSKELKKKLLNFGSTSESADIALFGRMVAENTAMNIDGATQVAHAISTHEVQSEIDFFTAVDDLKQPGEDAGAAMMGTVEFNSACYYRYSLVDLEQLVTNLGGDRAQAKTVVKAFLQAQAAAIPTGKQTSMAAQNLPHFIGFRVRKGGMPMSFVNAFEKPVWRSKDSLSAASFENLQQYEKDLAAMYGENGLVHKEDVVVGGGTSLASAIDGVIGALR